MVNQEIMSKGKTKITNFDGSDAKSTGLEDDPYAAGGNAFAEATDHSTGDHHVLHSLLLFEFL